jgi:hypothetical protein
VLRAFLIVLFVALVVAPAASAATDYGGSTRDGDPFVLTADDKGAKLRAAGFTFTVDCPTMGSVAVIAAPDVVPALPGDVDAMPTGVLVANRNARGRFETLMVDQLGIPAPLSATLSVSIDGRLKARSSRGTMIAVIAITDTQTGELVETCTMGPVRWTVRHAPGRVFAGTTSQGQPVVAVANAKRTVVTQLRFGWFTDDCTPGDGFVRLGDALSDFPLRRGAFADRFSQEYALEDGGLVQWDYDVRIRVSRTLATGSFSVVQTHVGAGVETVCRVPRTRWTARSR